MGLLKRTYSLPEDVLNSFESVVSRGRRSAVLASLIEAWLEERRLKKLRADIVTGCREMAGEYLEQEKTYHPLEEEVDRDR